MGALIINDVIFAELATRFATLEDLESFVLKASLTMVPIPRQSLFVASKVYATCRQLKGTKSGVLPDFFIGAHAAVASMPILTRDVARYRTYYPEVRLITPDKH